MATGRGRGQEEVPSLRGGQAREKQIPGPSPWMRKRTGSTRQRSKGQGVGWAISKGAEGGPHAQEGKAWEGRVLREKEPGSLFWKPTRQND